MSDPAPTLNIPARARLVLYVATALGSLLLTYGIAKGVGWLGDPEVALWSGIVALVNGLAAVNVRSGPRR